MYALSHAPLDRFRLVFLHPPLPYYVSSPHRGLLGRKSEIEARQARAFCCPSERRDLLHFQRILHFDHAIFFGLGLPPQSHRLIVVERHVYAVRIG